MDANVTIASIVYIVTLIVPGIFFKRFYFQGQFSNQFGSGLFADRMITSLFWGLMVQLITLLIFSNTINIQYEEKDLPISSVYHKLIENELPDFTFQNLKNTLFYLLASVFISFILGHISHIFIRTFKIDVKYRIFRFANNWHYFFKGEILASKAFKDSRKGKVLMVEVDLVTNNGDGKTKMFSGYLTEYNINNKGELENIFLTEAKRYSSDLEDFKPIPGDCLIVPYRNVLNINLRYDVEEEKKISLKKWVIVDAFRVFSLLSILFILIAPWFLDIEWWRKIIGIVLLTISLFSLMVCIYSAFIDREKKEKGLIKTSIIIWLFFLLCATVVLQIDFVTPIIHLFNK